MAAPAKNPAPKPEPAAKKTAPEKPGRASKAEGKAGGKSGAKSDAADAAATPAAPKSALQRYRLFLFIALGVAMVGTIATGAWVAYFRAPTEIDPPAPPPPALKPTPPTVVREGDLDDDLWRRMGVRPGSN